MQIRKIAKFGRWSILALALVTAWGAIAQNTAPPAKEPTPVPPPSAPAKRSATDLEKLAEPIALHPDPLISIILPAAVYPVEIVQAARFVRDTNNLSKVDDQPWDQNVKSAAKLPQLIAMMDSNLTWTVDLGEAFLDQPTELMDAIQSLRAKAQKAGTLQSTTQQIVTVTNVIVMQTNATQVVTVTNQVVEIYPANPQVVYVPTYPPTVYYPPVGYVYSAWAPLVTFGAAVAVGAIIANNCHWGHHHGGVYVGHHGAVAWSGGYHGDVNVNRNVNVNNSRNVSGGNRPGQGAGQANRPSQLPSQKWQPDQSRLRSSGAGGASASTREARGWSSGQTGSARPSTGAVGTRPSTGNVGARPSTGAVGTRPSTGASASTRPAASSTANRSAASSSTFQNRSSSSGSAFSGAGSSGSSARSYSSRGSSSRSSGSAGRSSGGFSGGSRGGGGRGGGGGGRR